MDATPGTVWVDTELPHVRVFGTAHSDAELSCSRCEQPIGGEAFVTDYDGDRVSATHQRCLPSEEQEEARVVRRLSGLWSRLRRS